MVVLDDLPNGRIQRFWNGQIIMVDLPRWKMQRFFKVMKNTNDFSKWSYCNKRPAHIKMQWIFFRSGEKCELFFKIVLL